MNSNSGTATVSVNSANLAPGSYSGTINASSSGKSASATVTLTVFDAYSLSPDALSFSTGAGTSPSSQQVTLSNSTSGSLSISLSPTQPWLTASISPNPVPGNGSAQITVKVNSSSLQVGNYSGSVNVSGGGTSRSISVTLQVTGVAISASPASVSLSVVVGQKATQQIQVVVSGGSVTVLISAAGQGVSAPGSINAPGSFTVTVDATKLAPGSYSGSLTLTCSGGSPCLPVGIPVSFTVTASNVSLSAAPATLNISVVEGQKTQAQLQVIVSVAGVSVSVQVTAAGAGLSGGTLNAPGSLTVNVDAAGLNPGGPFPGTLTLTCIGSPSCLPVVVPVNITVTPLDPFTLDTVSLSFNFSANIPAKAARGASSTQTVTLANATNSTLVISLGASSQGNWLTAIISPAQVPAKGTAIISISADSSKLAPSASLYTGSITVSGGGISKLITVGARVAGPLGSAPVISSFNASPGTISPGQSSLLRWTITDAASVAIDRGIGAVNAQTGTVNVSPSATTTYTLTANNQFGTVSAAVTVTVTSSPLTTVTKVMPQIVDGDSWQTTIVVVNRGSVQVTASLSFFMDTGGDATAPWPVQLANGANYQQIQLAPHAAVWMRTQGTAQNITVGYATLTGNANTEAFAIFKTRIPGRQDQEGTASAIPAGPRVLVPFDNTKGNVTSVALVNLGNATQTIGVKLRTVSGLTLNDSLTIPAGGHTAFRTVDKFQGSAGVQGLAELTNTNGLIAALALRFNTTGAFTTIPVFGTSTDAGGLRIIAQIADGAAWQSAIVLLNTGATSSSFQLGMFRDTAGGAVAWPLALNGQLVTSAQLQPGAALFLETPGTAPDLDTGYATINADSAVQAFAIFKQRVAGRQDQEGTAQAYAASTEVLTPFDNMDSNVTSLALVNTGAAQSLQVKFLNTASPLNVSAGGHTAFRLIDQFPSSLAAQGLVDFTGSSGLALIGLRFNSSGAFTSLPTFAAAVP